jgi:acetyl esterase/lipase
MDFLAGSLAACLAACLSVTALVAEPAWASLGGTASSSAGCTPAMRGRVLSTTALVRLSSTEVAAELRDVGLPDTARYGVETYRVVYCTVSTSESATTASGLLALPQDRRGTLPLVSYEHSTASAKTEAPSFLQQTEVRVVPFFFASAGLAVAAPDYLGLGTSPGRHPYLHAASEASVSLDMLRAANVVSGQRGVHLSHNVFVSGFSQGGQAAMATGQALQRSGGPWRLAALAPMAGPYDLPGAEAAAALDPDRTDPQHASVYFAYIFTAWKKLYHLYSDPHQVFTARYADLVEGLFDTSHGMTAIDAVLPAPEELFRPEILALITHPTSRYLAALRDNDTCHWVPSVPTRLYAAHGDRDVVFANAEQCRRQIVAQGGTAQVVDAGAVDHVGTAITALPLIRTWFSQLAAG